ncbi:RNA polymerase sigma-70 factor (ECF subfamily) [Arcticibacter tournemirensis]|uniref:RNA polymerase sigma-70 factor n=1 Tax=Arcticibacter tournemirensis TaxID=699437 RepID=A0A4V1KHX4_9SPHI|nr:RNA polymerase sigma-70 factor [Arcticibacter tournemirensis]KAA8484347.1 RNA polymerase sigma-70 factor [Arcticibacter tournemirensis]RXF68702.1 RNA polymerase sigma-70 factor [Arcticibacter tournemirensis]TQM49783.1 RNA polymerase sigma-70 factor (ECF subfamily) [Arcticibacter tournemirensis]
MGKATGIKKFTDEQLLAGIRNSDYEIFTILYSGYFQSLSLVSMKYVKDVFIAEGIVQDVFVRMWEDPTLIETVKSIRPYLYRSVINHSINYINRQKSIEQHHLRIADQMEDVNIETLHEEQELKKIIYAEIDRLPGQCKRIFKMSRFEGLKYREIAAELNISERTVENHIANALKILRSRLLVNTTGRGGLYQMKILMFLAF